MAKKILPEKNLPTNRKYSFPSGTDNPMWKGGRSVASNGYVLIRVGVEHHLADVRGYAYEHRVVAEQKIKRALKKRRDRASYQSQ